MSTFKSPLSIRFIYWTGNFAFWASIVLFAACFIFNILLHAGFFGSDLQLHTHLPGKVNFLETGILDHEQGEVKVEIVEASARIHFFNTPGFISKKVGIAMQIAIAFAVLLSYFFRSFMINIRRNSYFSVENIRNLKFLSYSIAAFWLYLVIYLRIAYHYFNKQLVFQNIRITDDIPNYPILLFLALMIWVIAHVFETGLKLKEEQELTI